MRDTAKGSLPAVMPHSTLRLAGGKFASQTAAGKMLHGGDLLKSYKDVMVMKMRLHTRLAISS